MNQPANRGQHGPSVNPAPWHADGTSDGVIAARNARPPTLWRAFAGLGIWAVCFTVLYTGHALACTMITASAGKGGLAPGTTSGVTWLLVAIWLFFVLWLAVLALRSGARVRTVSRQVRYREGGATNGVYAADYSLQDSESVGWVIVRRRSLRFMVTLTFVTDIASVVITVVSGLPVILTPACL